MILSPAGAVHPGTRIPTGFRAVVFDMDGALLDTERLWTRAEERLCAAHGVAYGPEDGTATLGVLALEACRHYAARFGLPDAAAPDLERELLALMAAELEAPIDLLPGAPELLARLHGTVPLAVASNSPRVVVDRAIEKSGVGRLFDAVVSAGDVLRPKPAPDLYLLACARLGVATRDALALEDSPVGAAAAIAAGMDCYLVAPSAPRELGIRMRIDSLVELLAPGPDGTAR